MQRWPGDELILTSAGCLLHIEYVSPTAEVTLDEIRQPAFTPRPDVIPSIDEQIEMFGAELQFAWIDAEHTGILCYRFGALPWRSIAHNPHRCTPAGHVAGLPTAARGAHLVVAVGLGHPVVCVREVAWAESFVAAVRTTVSRLAAQPFMAQLAIDGANFLYVFERSEGLAQRAQASIMSPAVTHPDN